MKYLSDQLVSKLEEDTNSKFKLCDRRKMQKTIRDYFIQIHEGAIDSEIIARNRKNYVRSNFEDK